MGRGWAGWCGLWTLVSAVLLAGCGTHTVNGACSPACGAGTHCDNTSGACVPDGTAGPDLAMSGACPRPCSGSTPHCDPSGKCVMCLADGDCPAGQLCKSPTGTCSPGCNDDARCKGPNAMSPLACCNHHCVDTSSDGANCGACGTSCSGAHAAAACQNGACALTGTCDAGWGDCNKDPKDGCEANLHVDPNNCTACGMKCAIPNAVNGCADGCYETACSFGFDDCNDDLTDGCETSVLSDGANCGACRMSCSKLPNASAGCMNAGCVLGKCDPGFSDCNGDPKDGCEAQTDYDPKNCGACGTLCPMNAPSCSMGKCGVGADYGPMHTFVGMTTDHYITQGGCSAGMGMPNANDIDALYFCQHFYLPNCKPKPGYHLMQTPNPTYPKMHKNGGCTGNGSDIPGKTCDMGPCKIGNWNESTNGLVGLICHCQ